MTNASCQSLTATVITDDRQKNSKKSERRKGIESATRSLLLESRRGQIGEGIAKIEMELSVRVSDVRRVKESGTLNRRTGGMLMSEISVVNHTLARR